MSGCASLAVALLAAGAVDPAVPLVKDAAPPPSPAAPRVLVCLPRGSGTLEPSVATAFSWASLVTISPDNVARRFPPSDVTRATAADERRLDEVLRAAEADFLALRF